LEDEATQMAFSDRVTVMVIALYNIAAEHEHLKQFTSSLIHYEKAKNFSETLLGKSHSMTKKMTDVLQDAS
jgi:hypothetical protein